MTLKADIKYKSNWQVGALKGPSTPSPTPLPIPLHANPYSPAQRRNKWVCALKTSLHAVQIFGPSGNPSAPAGPKEITLVPYSGPGGDGNMEDISMPLPSHVHEGTTGSGHGVPRGDWKFADKNAVLLDDSRDVFGEHEELHMPTPQGTLSSGVSTSMAIRGRDGMTQDMSGAAVPGNGAVRRMPLASSPIHEQDPEEIEMSQPMRSTPNTWSQGHNQI